MSMTYLEYRFFCRVELLLILDFFPYENLVYTTFTFEI